MTDKATEHQKRRNTGQGMYVIGDQIFSASSLTDAKKQARQWRKQRGTIAGRPSSDGSGRWVDDETISTATAAGERCAMTPELTVDKLDGLMMRAINKKLHGTGHVKVTPLELVALCDAARRGIEVKQLLEKYEWDAAYKAAGCGRAALQKARSDAP